MLRYFSKFVFSPRYFHLYITVVFPDAVSARQTRLCLPLCSSQPCMTSASAQYILSRRVVPPQVPLPLILFPDASSSVFSPFKPPWMQILIPPWFLVTLTFAKSAFPFSSGRGKSSSSYLYFQFWYYKFKMLKRVKAGTFRPIVCYRWIYYPW